MRAFLLFFVVLGGLVWPLATRAQVYHLTSWEGQPVSISLSSKMFGKRLAVSCAGDSLFLLNSPGAESARVLQHRFLQINFETRCGSNCRTQSTAIVSVREHKLFVSLLVNSLAESEDFTPGNERAYHYRVTLDMLGGAAGPYTLQARVHEEEAFQRKPGQNHTLDKQAALHWDAARYVFYSAFEPTARCLSVFDEEAKNPFKPGDLSALPLVQPELNIPYYPVVPQWVVGTFPVVRLGSTLYYSIQGDWYEGPAKPDLDGDYWFTKNEIQYVPGREQIP